MAGILYDDVPFGLFHFILLIVVLGGGTAIATGSAVARGWRPFLVVPVYMVGLAAALRFLNYAMFGGELLSPVGYVVALVIVMIAAAYGYRAQRATQMATQYSWLYAKSGPLGWSRKSA